MGSVLDRSWVLRSWGLSAISKRITRVTLLRTRLISTYEPAEFIGFKV